MTVMTAWRDGVGRVNRAPTILLAVWAMTVAASLPLTLVLRSMIAQHLGSSLAADTAAAGVNYDWMHEFADQASGIGVTFNATVIGFGAVLDNLSATLDDVSRPLVIAGAASAYVVLWLFVAGGVLDRYARDRATRSYGFFAAAGLFFWRFLRLAAIQWVTYAVLFGWVHPLLFHRLFPRMTHEVAVERTAFLIRVALYAVFLILLGTCTLIFDYAKVRAVVEDRRSALGAVAGSIRFIRRNPGAMALFLVNVAAFAIVVLLYAALAPGAGGRGLGMWLVVVIGQVYIAARLWVKLAFWASETALFQGRLAHAGYVAAATPIWPESPAAEAIRR
jgi:hypothetical protein